jgi:N-acetyl-anhydromuramyl-L-alanine amidase AmpD
VSALDIRDVRAAMPGHDPSRAAAPRPGLSGIALHHSATANPVVGLAGEDARAIFRYHVETLGWRHGGYHYLVHPGGLIEYALDETLPAPHAGFRDPEDRLGLERGQYWNRHFLAVCLLGWFDRDRVDPGSGAAIPNRFTAPTGQQLRALTGLLRDLCRRHRIPPRQVRGHRELAGCRTRCPGTNIDLDGLRAALAAPGPGGAP